MIRYLKLVEEQYLPDVPDEDVALLKVEKEEDIFLLSVVNIKNDPELEITTNLLSPIVVSWKEGLGKQVILRNHYLYSVKHAIHLGSSE